MLKKRYQLPAALISDLDFAGDPVLNITYAVQPGRY